MGYCPCFGLLMGKKLKSDDKKKHPSYNHASKRDSATKYNVDMRDMSYATKDGYNTPNMAPTIAYQELAIATNNFSQESLIGRGGFGAVFKGKLATGQAVAVKQLDQTGIQGEKEFLVEVLMLSLLHHPNLVKLIGYCGEGTQRLLVYEYMPLGSLDDHLFDVTPEMKPLDWNTRMKIAAGAARGLKSLHCADPPVIYRDLKASNILLDEEFHPKLSDFGLAKFAPSGDLSHVSTRVMGTYGYCAPEYASTGKLTMKTDIYSYGIVLLELITGHRAVDEINGHHKHLTTWALPLMKNRNSFPQLADPLLRGEFSVSVLSKAIEVASMCLNENASLRPSSSDLVLAMEYLESRKYQQHKESNNYKEVSSAKWPEIAFSPSETTAMLDKDLDRDKAVAEAKTWGETWRDKEKQGSRNVSEDNSSWVNKVQHGQ